MKIAYINTISELTVKKQLELLNQHGCDKYFKDESKENINRTSFNLMMKILKEQDQLFIVSVNVLPVTAYELVDLETTLRNKKVQLIIADQEEEVRFFSFINDLNHLMEKNGYRESVP